MFDSYKAEQSTQICHRLTIKKSGIFDSLAMLASYKLFSLPKQALDTSKQIRAVSLQLGSVLPLTVCFHICFFSRKLVLDMLHHIFMKLEDNKNVHVHALPFI